MRFRLIYEGELRPSQRDPIDKQTAPLGAHKQAIRKVFHSQLKHLWATNKFLSSHRMAPYEFQNPDPEKLPTSPAVYAGNEDGYLPMVKVIAMNYERSGYHFVPLVRDDMQLSCNLDILFLRRDIPGSVIEVGDLDNRVKTLIDCLRMPKGANELKGHETPGPDETPFFCLLEDDRLVTGLSVESDTLLSPLTGDKENDRRQVHAVITVELKPYNVTMFNLSFA